MCYVPPTPEANSGLLLRLLHLFAFRVQLVEERRVPINDLATQRRMRPEIADLIRPAVYPNLKDAPQVQKYPPVKGMRRNLFFWDHAVPEDMSGTVASSKTNRYRRCTQTGATEYSWCEKFVPDLSNDQIHSMREERHSVENPVQRIILERRSITGNRVKTMFILSNQAMSVGFAEAVSALRVGCMVLRRDVNTVSLSLSLSGDLANEFIGISQFPGTRPSLCQDWCSTFSSKATRSMETSPSSLRTSGSSLCSGTWLAGLASCTCR